MAQLTGWYDAHAPDLVRRYEGVNPAALHSWLKGLLPGAPGTVLDIGSGSGRNAAWFSEQGYDVIAVEPSNGMRSEGQRLRPEPRIRWIDDQPPDLTILGPMAISFERSARSVDRLSLVTAQHRNPMRSERLARVEVAANRLLPECAGIPAAPGPKS